MKKSMVGIVVAVFLAFFPFCLNAGLKLSDNVTFGAGPYLANATAMVVELPMEYNFQGDFSLSSSGSGRSLSYLLGAGKDLFFQTVSVNGFYCGNYSDAYISDAGEISFSCRPFAHLTTFVDIQLEAGYSYTVHSNLSRTKTLPAHAVRIGAGIAVLQTTNLAVSYANYFYMPVDGQSLQQLQGDITATQNLRLSGILSATSGFPESIVDLSLSHLLLANLNAYVSYSRIQYALGSGIANSIVIGADYFLLDNLSVGAAHNIMFSADSTISNYTSVSVGVNF